MAKEVGMVSSEDMVSVPSRGAIFLNNRVAYGRSMFFLVSVPSRGAIFLNLSTHTFSGKGKKNVSVPSRGAIFLNIESRKKEAKR